MSNTHNPTGLEIVRKPSIESRASSVLMLKHGSQVASARSLASMLLDFSLILSDPCSRRHSLGLNILREFSLKSLPKFRNPETVPLIRRMGRWDRVKNLSIGIR
jgi:hypothetical protein